MGAPARLAGRRYVVAIGINAYAQLPPLRNAVADARRGMALFERLGFEAVRPPIVDGEATREALWRLVTDELAALGNQDSLVVLFAGHGGTRSQNLDDATTIKTGFLIPVDADAEGYSSWINLDYWLDQLAKSQLRHILVVIDACHSGLALGPVIKYRDVKPARRDQLDALSRRRSRRIITSAADDELAQDGGPVPDHSLFMGCLLEGLEGELAQPDRDVVTGSELGVYLQRRVMTLSNKLQTPDFGAFAHDQRGELMIPVLRPESSESSDSGDRGDLPPTKIKDTDPEEPPRRSAPRSRIVLALAGAALTGGLIAAVAQRDCSPSAPARDAGAPGQGDERRDSRGTPQDGPMPSTTAELVRRVVARDLPAVQALLAAKVSARVEADLELEPCWPGRASITVLTRAVLDGEVEIARALLAAGAAADAISYEADKPTASDAHRTPLLIAARCSASNHAELVQLLLGYRADAKVLTPLGETVLFRCRAPGAVAELVKAGAALEAISASGETALMTAARDGDAKLLGALLEAGADPNHAAGGESPLGVAAEHHPALMAPLLLAGARLPRDLTALLLRTVGDGEQARLAAARELVVRGANPNGTIQGKPLLEHLMTREDLGGARALVRLGAHFDAVLRSASRALAAGRYAEAYRQCSVVADAIESTEAAWLCAQANCGLGDRDKARSYAARSAEDRREVFENLCANMLP